jgi:hypothetical protein
MEREANGFRSEIWEQTLQNQPAISMEHTGCTWLPFFLLLD